MNKIKHALLLIVCMLIVFVATGCKEKTADNSTKTVIKVLFYNAGYGSVYMEDAEKEFERIYANTSFEEGKVGVDVIPDGKKAIGTDIQWTT